MAGFSALVLHSWTLESTALAGFLSAAKNTGWDAVELRHADFMRARDAGGSDAQVITQVREAALPVACLGVERGWMWARGAERTRLLAGFAEDCGRAQALGCMRLMSTVDAGTGGSHTDAVASLREVGAMAADAGLVLAFEFSSQSAHINSLARARDLVASAGHAGCRLLLDTYHLFRSGATLEEIAELDAAEIAYVQYSDVPAGQPVAGMTLDRLPPGQGQIPFKEVLAAILHTGYAGPLSYEAPNTQAWEQAPEKVAREALMATRAVLSRLD
jgi:4-hydroxyphenylpyruvate dioxygenase